MADELSVSEIMSHTARRKPFSSAFIRKFIMDNIPDTHKNELQKAVIFLKGKGCKEVFLFGSLVTGKCHENSDIDIGIKGVPKGIYLSLYGHLLCDMNIPFDLVNFDVSNDFYNELKGYKELIKIG
jgi:predicted nucleotidyltransferase